MNGIHRFPDKVPVMKQLFSCHEIIMFILVVKLLIQVYQWSFMVSDQQLSETKRFASYSESVCLIELPIIYVLNQLCLILWAMNINGFIYTNQYLRLYYINYIYWNKIQGKNAKVWFYSSPCRNSLMSIILPLDYMSSNSFHFYVVNTSFVSTLYHTLQYCYGVFTNMHMVSYKTNGKMFSLKYSM